MKYRRLGEEVMYAGVLMTRVKRRPPMWRLQTSDGEGKPLFALLSGTPKGTPKTPWALGLPPELATLLPPKRPLRFRTRAQAIGFFGRLQTIVVPVPEPEKVPSSAVVGSGRPSEPEDDAAPLLEEEAPEGRPETP